MLSETLSERTRTIEMALHAMMLAMSEPSLPLDVRHKVATAHAALHGCRSAQQVVRMERAMGLAARSAAP